MEYIVESEVLQAAIFGSHYCESSTLITEGWINGDKYKSARAMLSYCASRIFNIHRLPGYEEGHLREYNFKYHETFKPVSVNDANFAFEDLNKLYTYTQKQLKEADPSGKGTIKIFRLLSPYEIAQVANQLISGQEQIIYSSNIISSYNDNGRLGEYSSSVLLVREVDIKNILIHYNYLKYPSACTADEKENEIFYVNTDPHGQEYIDRSCFKFNENELRKNYSLSAESLDSYKHIKDIYSSYTNLYNYRDIKCLTPLNNRIYKFLKRFEK